MNTNNYENLDISAKSVYVVFLGTQRKGLLKKIATKNSHATVPLKALQIRPPRLKAQNAMQFSSVQTAVRAGTCSPALLPVYSASDVGVSVPPDQHCDTSLHKMGPKTAASKAPETLEDVITVLKSLSAKFDTFSTKLTTVETLRKQVKAMDAKMTSLEAKLMDVLEVNKNLKADLKAKDKSIEDLSTGYSNLVSRCNELEQYNRSWSVGIAEGLL